ncbi:MAG: methyltransferase family protein [Candidatus Helarchaeota archaeon]
MPKAHLLQFLSAILMAITLLVDSILHFSTSLLSYIPLEIRIVGFGLILSFALIFMYRAHKILFTDSEAPAHLITDGIFDQVRHPMYTGILLLYLAFVVLTMSLIGLGVWFLIVFIYNKLATYEEKILEDLYGEQYHEYKKRTRKFLAG